MSSGSQAVVQSLIDGTLRPETTIISDSLVQPGLTLFREILVQAIKRNERVLLLLTENYAPKLLGNQYKQANNLKIIDCFSGSGEDGSSGKLAGSAQTHYVDFHMLHTISEDFEDISEVVRKFQPSLLLVDSLNVLETFNGCPSTYRMLKSILATSTRQDGISLVALHHTDVPNLPSTSTAIPLISSILSPSFSTALLHLKLHTPSILAHLNHAYGLEQVGQDPTEDIDTRVFDFLPLLHSRHWASPLHVSEIDEHVNEDLDVGQFDSPSSKDVRMGLLEAKGHNAGRCVVEYSMRGIAKNRKRSEAAKIVRGLEGIKAIWSERNQMPSVVAVEDVSEVARVRARQIQGGTKRADSDKVMDPVSAAVFNVSLTDRQREMREGVALPYTPKDTGEIIYQPDSADDLDESDPDEDLDL